MINLRLIGGCSVLVLVGSDWVSLGDVEKSHGQGLRLRGVYRVHMMPASRQVRSYRRPFLHILMIGSVVKTKRRKGKKGTILCSIYSGEVLSTFTNIHKLQ